MRSYGRSLAEVFDDRLAAEATPPHRTPTPLLCILQSTTGGTHQNMSDRTPEEQRLLTPAYRGLFLFCMFILCAFNFADRAIFSVLARSIAIDLKLTDFQLGMLQGLCFAALYALFGIPFGRLAHAYAEAREGELDEVLGHSAQSGGR